MPISKTAEQIHQYLFRKTFPNWMRDWGKKLWSNKADYYSAVGNKAQRVTNAAGWVADKVSRTGQYIAENPGKTVPLVAAAGVMAYNAPKVVDKYVQHTDPRYDTTQYNGWTGISMRKQADWGKNLETIGKGIGAVIAAGKGISLAHNFVTGIVGNFEQKKVIDKLINTDPIIKNADRQQVMSFFKTICNMAPSISTDENMVKDLLYNFIKFGRIDMQSLKLLVDAEKTYKDSSTPLWAKVK